MCVHCLGKAILGMRESVYVEISVCLCVCGFFVCCLFCLFVFVCLFVLFCCCFRFVIATIKFLPSPFAIFLVYTCACVCPGCAKFTFLSVFLTRKNRIKEPNNYFLTVSQATLLCLCLCLSVCLSVCVSVSLSLSPHHSFTVFFPSRVYSRSCFTL